MAVTPYSQWIFERQCLRFFPGRGILTPAAGYTRTLAPGDSHLIEATITVEQL